MLQSQKQLALFSQTEKTQALSAEKNAIRTKYREIWDKDDILQEDYKDYTQIPDFEKEIEKATTIYQTELDEIAAWETAIDNQITTLSAELEEEKAYLQSYKSMEAQNIQEDYDFGLGG